MTGAAPAQMLAMIQTCSRCHNCMALTNGSTRFHPTTSSTRKHAAATACHPTHKSTSSHARPASSLTSCHSCCPTTSFPTSTAAHEPAAAFNRCKALQQMLPGSTPPARFPHSTKQQHLRKHVHCCRHHPTHFDGKKRTHHMLQWALMRARPPHSPAATAAVPADHESTQIPPTTQQHASALLPPPVPSSQCANMPHTSPHARPASSLTSCHSCCPTTSLPTSPPGLTSAHSTPPCAAFALPQPLTPAAEPPLTAATP